MSPDDLPDEQVAVIDAFLIANNPISAVKRIRELTGLGLHDSAEVMRRRYLQLRETRPDSFVLTEREYWEGWYS